MSPAYSPTSPQYSPTSLEESEDEDLSRVEVVEDQADVELKKKMMDCFSKLLAFTWHNTYLPTNEPDSSALGSIYALLHAPIEAYLSLGDAVWTLKGKPAPPEWFIKLVCKTIANGLHGSSYNPWRVQLWTKIAKNKMGDITLSEAPPVWYRKCHWREVRKHLAAAYEQPVNINIGANDVHLKYRMISIYLGWECVRMELGNAERVPNVALHSVKCRMTPKQFAGFLKGNSMQRKAIQRAWEKPRGLARVATTPPVATPIAPIAHKGGIKTLASAIRKRNQKVQQKETKEKKAFEQAEKRAEREHDKIVQPRFAEEVSQYNTATFPTTGVSLKYATESDCIEASSSMLGQIDASIVANNAPDAVRSKRIVEMLTQWWGYEDPRATFQSATDGIGL